MRRLYIYILALLALSMSCQRLELPEEVPSEKPTGAVGSKATITFSTAELMDTETKAIIDPSVDVNTLHLIVFDENGMYVETCEATKLGSSDHGDHHSGRHYTVTLTLTDKPRIIHFVANCPVDQIIYGHEISVIGNMYVDKTDREYRTEYETSYWARIEVPFILVEEKEEVVEGETVTKVSLHPDIVYKFNHVPLLRNYAEITVTDQTDDKFIFLGYTVYNVLDRGTVAPYNSNTQEFQNFLYHPDPTQADVLPYSYPQLFKDQRYEGHALTSAELITDYANTGEFLNDKPFYIYERKVSVMTDEEEKWKESPPHIIIKGRYNHGQTATDQSPVYYYKMDLVYTETDAQGHDEIKYYNIIRNFNYQFNLTAVHDEGYTDINDAISGPSGNNLSGSTTTSKLTDISDNQGRLLVSYTDTTLVTNNAVTLKFKYMPNYYTSDEVQNNLVRFENVEGDVITGIDIAYSDITEGQWKGFRNVTVYVNEQEHIAKMQTLTLKTSSVHLTRDIRFTLREKFTMDVECTPKVATSMMEPVQVDIKLPLGLTEDMFPLELDIETFDRTLSPDPLKNGTTNIPVKAGPSIIDVDGRRGEQSYFYTVTIPTYASYQALDTEGNTKVYHTHWLTNRAKNASTVYVDNKYFNQASDRWVNYEYTFSNLTCSTSEVGVGKNVTIGFTMAEGAYNTPVTISLVGMVYTGTLGGVTYTNATELIYTPTGRNVQISDGLKTTTDQDKVSFTLDADKYAVASKEGERNTFKFNGAFDGNVTRFELAAGVEADFSFDIPEAAFNAGYKSVYVMLDRLVPTDDAKNNNLEYAGERSVRDLYRYTAEQAGRQTIRLATAYAEEGVCSVTLEAQYYETEVITVEQADQRLLFRDLTLPEKVNAGTGKNVDIKFKLAEGETANKIVTVTLVNMTINGSHTYEFSTADNKADKDGNYTIKAVTADEPAGVLKVTLSADGYDNAYIECANRPIVIPKSKLVTTMQNTDFANNGTIYIFNEDPSKNTAESISSYPYTRIQTSSGWGQNQYREANNTNEIQLSGFKINDVIYLRYTTQPSWNGSVTNYYGKIKVTADFIQNGGTVSLSTTLN